MRSEVRSTCLHEMNLLAVTAQGGYMRHSLRQIVVGVSCALGSAVTPLAYGQQSAETDTGGVTLEEISVTARRTTENRQDVPLTIGVVSAADITRNDIITTADLERRTPGFSICCGRAITFTFLRGVPGVVSYFAEAPTAPASDALMFDLGGVQVLKGPQGTLFGLASNGGAFLFEPQRPTSNFGGHAQVIMGEDGRRGAEAVMNIPIGDTLALRLGVLTDEADGYVRDLSQNKMIGSDNHQIGRVSLLWTPSANFENYTVANYYEFDADDTAMKHLGFVNPNSPAALRFPDYPNYFAEQPALGHYQIAGSALETFTRVEQLNASNITRWDINDVFTLKNILGYSERTYWDRNNSDGTPELISDSNVYGTKPGPTARLSEELQLQGSFLDNILKVQLGGYYQHTTLDRPGITYNYSLGNLNGNETENESLTRAVYGQATYDASGWIEGLSLTAGYRYTWDHLEFRQQRYNAAGAPVGAFVDLEGDFSAPSYTLSATYEVTPDVMVYFTNSKGYSTGGFNTTAPPEFQLYDPESLNNFEIGMKSQWSLGDAILRTNIAAFYGKYDDIQALTNVIVQTPAGPVSSTLRQNAAKAHTQGAELEATLRVGDLQFDANVGYQKAEYDDYMSGGVDMTYVPIYYIAEWKYALNARYELPVPVTLGEMAVNANYTWQDDMPSPASYISDIFDIPAFGSLNLGFDWREMFGSRIGATLLVTNVTNNWHTSNANHVYDTTGFFNYDVAIPRRWSLRVRYDF